MAEKNEDRNRGSQEPASFHKETNRNGGWQIPGANFDEMNYEQRRVPYNSDQKVNSDTEKDPGQHNHSSDSRQ